MSNHADPLFALTMLERRVMLSGTPASPRPDDLGNYFTKGHRQIIVEQMHGLPDSTENALRQAAGLDGGSASNATFDSLLRDYFEGVTDRWYWNANDVSLLSSTQRFYGVDSAEETRMDAMVEDRLFPTSGSASTYTVSVPGDIDFTDASPSPSTEFIYAINRHGYFLDLAQVGAESGQARYIDELEYQMARWHQDFYTLSNTFDWSGSIDTQAFSAGIRAENWIWSWQTLIDSPDVSDATTSLVAYQMLQHGEFLANALSGGLQLESNRTTKSAKALMLIGTMFSEADDAAAWTELGRDVVQQSLVAQHYSDGGHLEQSPGYAANVLEDVIEVRLLDKINGVTDDWPTYDTLIDNAVEAFRQVLTPDGKRPALGDTYRATDVTVFLRAGLVSGQIVPTPVQTTAAASNTDTLLQLDAVSGIKVNDVIGIGGAISGGEVMLVTHVDSGASTVTVERSYGGTGSYGLFSGRTLTVLGQHPMAKPRLRDLWLFGRDTIYPITGDLPASGVLGTRGKTYALPDAGNYVMRSGEHADATQVLFDAGPRGGAHGHYDLFNLDIFAGRPLIPDPGQYRYIDGPDRDYVVSSAAHNTVAIDGRNVGGVEGQGNPALKVSQWDVTSNAAQVTASHQAYNHLEGSPVVSRSVWYDLDGTMLVVDWVESSRAHTVETSFNLPREAAANTTGYGSGYIKTRYADGKNVQITPLNPGDLARRSTFYTNDAGDGDYKEDGWRFTNAKTGDYVMFATLIQVYDGNSVPSVNASLSGGANPGDTVTINLSGVLSDTVTFTPPAQTRFTDETGRNTGVDVDIAYGQDGRLHMAYMDWDDKSLKYAVRDANDAWSIPIAVDDGDFVGAWPDLEIDSVGRPHIAYYSVSDTGLKYATINPGTEAWETVTVDTAGSVGQYPSLALSKSNAPTIAYYRKTSGDLKLAIRQGSDWEITNLKTGGDVGRHPEILRDPNRPTANKYAIAYTDSTNDDIRYMIQRGDGWEDSMVADLELHGGDVNLAFYDSGTNDSYNHKAVVSYMNRGTGKFYMAWQDNSFNWLRSGVTGNGRQGLYSDLYFTDGTHPNLVWWDQNRNVLRHAWGTFNGDQFNTNWNHTEIGTGGRWASAAMDPTTNTVSLTNSGFTSGFNRIEDILS